MWKVKYQTKFNQSWIKYDQLRETVAFDSAQKFYVVTLLSGATTPLDEALTRDSEALGSLPA